MSAAREFYGEERLFRIRSSDEYALAALIAELIIAKSKEGIAFDLAKAIDLVDFPDFAGIDGAHQQRLIDAFVSLRTKLSR